MKVVSLFSGIGAYERALKNVGIDVELVNYCEILKDKSRAYSILHNVSEDKNLWDITKINPKEIEDFDLLCYSPPCFTKGHLVMTNKGYKNIEDIVEGDMVLTHKGRFKKVLKTMYKKTDNLYKVKAMGISPYIECTGEHPFYVKNRKIKYKHRGYDYIFSEPFWKCAKDLNGTLIDNKDVDFIGTIHNLQDYSLPNWEGIEVTRWKKKQNLLCEKFEDNRFWYFVGRFLGDGWIRKKIYSEPYKKDRYETIICCNYNELEDFKNKIGNLFNYVVCKDRTVAKLRITNKELTLFMEQFGRGAINKHFTDVIFNLPNKYLIEVLKGLMDSDGSGVNNDYTEGQLTSISKQLVYGLGFILKRLEMPYTITYNERPKKYMIEGREVNQHATYLIRFNKNKLKNNSFFDDNILWNPVREVKKVELNDLEVVYNLEVEEDNSYTVDNIIVHNCQAFSLAGKMKGLDDLRGALFYNALKVIEEKKPKYCVMENVGNLPRKFKNEFSDMCKALEMVGYNNYWKIINARDFIPQFRERVYLVSIRKDIDKGNFEFPVGSDTRNWWNLIDLSDMRDITNRQRRMIEYAQGKNTEDKIKLEGNVQFDNAVITLRQSGLRFQSNREYPALTAHYGKGGGNFTVIAKDGKVLGGITPRNCFKLMGFNFEDSDLLTKEGFSKSSQYIMAGDSVCVPVLEEIFRNLFLK